MTIRYQIIVDSPLGSRSGVLALRETAGRVTGTLSLLGGDNPVEGTREGQTLHLRHALRTRVSQLDCETALRLADGAMEGTIRVGPTCMQIRGTALPDDMEERMKVQV